MKKKNRNFWPALIILLFVTLIAVKALFKPGFYTNHDGEHQIVRLHQFHKLLNEGQIPVRWAGDLRNGYGYPLFIFSYRLPWYLGEPLLRLGFSLVNTIKALFIIAMLLSAVFMFLWQKELWGVWAGLLASVLYIWAPYRFSVNLVRAALGEAFAIAFAPLLFYSLQRLAKAKDRRFIYIGALAFTGMLLSHAITTWLYLPVVAGYTALLLVNLTKNQRLMLIKRISGLLALGLGLSAFYWLPAGYGRRFIPALGAEFFVDHLLILKQLLYSPWGYTFSMPGVEQDGMSFQAGIAQWLAVAAVLVSAVYFWLVKKSSRKPDQADNRLVAFFLLTFGFSIFLMVEPSRVVWKMFSQVVLIDYPWRLISISVLAASSLAGAVFKSWEKFRWPLAWSFFAGLLLVAFYTNRNHLKVNQYTFFPESFYTENVGTSNSYDEYTPYWGRGDYLKTRRDILEFALKPGAPQGQGRILNIDRPNSTQIEVDFEVTSPQALMRLNSLYYPGWQLFLDDQVVKFDYQSSQGVMDFISPEGKHHLQAVFKETPLRLTADWLSVLSLLILVIGLWKQKYA
ncbi:hypothetical protein KKD62_02080 [Patescibacteria group bacterium]|nr:hypothetical protein [Patescibacteria group bacterium]MBU1931208.1 hypothetical protein [Patescibacteria group bacterium]